MYTELRRTWAEINLDHLKYNYNTLRERIGANCKFLGVVKADAYGHGATQVAEELQNLGADYLAVSSTDEGRELRDAGITMPILVLGHTPKDQVETLIKYNITQAVTCESKALEYNEEAQKIGKKLRVHIKLDTGMSRLGFLCDGDHFSHGVEAVYHAVTLPYLDTEGVFTHFSLSDEYTDFAKEYTKKQFQLFCDVIHAVEAKGFTFRIKHCANTGAVANYPETYLDMVRPGLLLYGYGPEAKRLGLKPVMELKTTISTIKIYEPGTCVSYGATWTSERKTRMGVVPIGYADGLFRSLSNHYAFYTADGPAEIRGRICMDMCMIDLTDAPNVGVGDEVSVFGEHNSLDDMAAAAGTIPYELTCAVSKRVPRVFYKDGKEVDRELKLKIMDNH
ncbi:MAG: alanine racemase [Lachnospiraceae bacterium]|nr:alanine racemase [Lachnospiraceae bacterium]